MLRNIETHIFHLFGHADANRHLDRHKEKARHDSSPREDGDSADELHAKLLACAASLARAGVGVGGVLHIGVGAKDASGQESPEAARSVHGEGVQRIVHLELEQQAGGAEAHEGADHADKDGVPVVDDRAVGSDGDQAAQDAVECEANVKVFLCSASAVGTCQYIQPGGSAAEVRQCVCGDGS